MAVGRAAADYPCPASISTLKHELFRPVVSLFGTLTPGRTERCRNANRRNNRAGRRIGALQRAATLLPPQAADLRPAFLMWQPERGVYRVGFEQTGHWRTFRVRFEQVYLDSVSGALKARRGYGNGFACRCVSRLAVPAAQRPDVRPAGPAAVSQPEAGDRNAGADRHRYLVEKRSAQGAVSRRAGATDSLVARLLRLPDDSN